MPAQSSQAGARDAEPFDFEYHFRRAKTRSKLNVPDSSEVDHCYNDIPMWAVDLGAAIGGTWMPLLRKDPRNAARILKRLRVVERNTPPLQQYLFLVDVLDWLETEVDSTEEQCAVVDSGLTTIVFAILLDKRAVIPGFVEIVLMNQARFLGVLFRTSTVLGIMICSLVVRFHDSLEAASLASNTFQRSINNALDRLGDIFKLLWEKHQFWYRHELPTRILVRPSDKKRTDLKFEFKDVHELISMWKQAQRAYRKPTPHDVAYYGRILFLLWIVVPRGSPAQLIILLTREVAEAFKDLSSDQTHTVISDFVDHTAPASRNRSAPFHCHRNACSVRGSRNCRQRARKRAQFADVCLL
ncbi:hypothetical protein K474DRAFT_1044900 [Panus rudis PR-1116 ss-1]|nr:hypothetical protein K474DRAFT_1044900 [Panus rudis PR-1116 ss-1]